MRPEAKAQIYSITKTYQQIKLLECEASLINSKELTEKEKAKVTDLKLKYEKIVKLCCIGCVSIFPDPTRSLFIA